MLTNLFSMFDPTIHSMNPMALVIFMAFFFLLIKTEKFLMFSKYNISVSMLMLFLKKELGNEVKTMSMKKKAIKNFGAEKLFYFMLILIFLVNFSSLFPYIISITSHISLNFPMAFIIWLSIVIISLLVNWKNFLAHLTPSGTPIALMSFMVLIETVSSIIRPLTLSVRLMANMVAGHLLLLLLSNFSMISISNTFLSSAIMIILGTLEMGVSLIQSYVFVLLCILYAKEAF